jgi:hypothetical protein
MKILDIITKNQKDKGSRIGLLTTAATTGVTVAKFLGKRSIYGIVGGIAVTLAAEYIKKKYDQKVESQNAVDDAVVENK